MTSEKFATEMINAFTSGTYPVKGKRSEQQIEPKLSQKEVDEWLKIFSGESWGYFVLCDGVGSQVCPAAKQGHRELTPYTEIWIAKLILYNQSDAEIELKQMPNHDGWKKIASVAVGN